MCVLVLSLDLDLDNCCCALLLFRRKNKHTHIGCCQWIDRNKSKVATFDSFHIPSAAGRSLWTKFKKSWGLDEGLSPTPHCLFGNSRMTGGKFQQLVLSECDSNEAVQIALWIYLPRIDQFFDWNWRVKVNMRKEESQLVLSLPKVIPKYINGQNRWNCDFSADKKHLNLVIKCYCPDAGLWNTYKWESQLHKEETSFLSMNR